MKIAMDAIRDFLLEEEMLVYLVVYSRDAFALSEKLFRDVRSFIDDHYTQENDLLQYGAADKCQLRYAQQSRILEVQETCAPDACVLPSPEAPPMPAPQQSAKAFTIPPAPARKKAPPFRPAAPTAAPVSLEDLLRQEDKGFSEHLLELIDRTGLKDSVIYGRANVSRQHFSKIRNNPQYKPTKATALAFAIALELDMEGTRDLIGRAGYALTKASKFDLIIMYFIQVGNYNIFDINAALFEFDQSLLGG